MATTFMKQAHGILRDAEVKLCELIPKALAGRRDEEAGQLMELARLLADARCSPACACPHADRRAASGSGEQGGAATLAGADTPRGPRPVRKQRAKARKKRKASPYPKFFREGNALLKLGWSRKSKAEYEHRAPCEAVLAVAERVAEVASRGAAVTTSRFTVEDLGEVRAAQGDEPISSCQVYLCIAWFRRAGLVVQHGRRGYSLPVAPARLPARVKSAWRELRER
jgi:hypothetical protein